MTRANSMWTAIAAGRRMAAAAALVVAAGCGVNGSTADGGSALMDGSGADAPGDRDAGSDAGSQSECARRCHATADVCGWSAADSCDSICATYDALSAGCEVELRALEDCAFDPVSCTGCSFVGGPEVDTFVSCVVDHSDDPCFVFCRAANGAGCGFGHGPVGHQECNCVARYGSGGSCGPQVNAAYTCAVAHPCDRDVACAAENDAVNTCALGCPSGEVGCYTGSTGRCLATASLATDPENCGRCNNRCGPLGSCVSGACACMTGSHLCPGTGCVADDDAAHCGASCVSCSTTVGHATASCNAGSCDFTCDGGYTSTDGACVRDCPTGQHACGDSCFPDDDIAHCGTSCTACPPAPTNGHEVCDRGSCASACDLGYYDVGGLCLACDPFTGTGCAAGDWCYSSGGGLFCGTPGSDAEGAACTAGSCGRGLLCIRVGTAPLACRRVCDAGATGACAGADRCRALSGAFPPNLGVCAP